MIPAYGRQHKQEWAAPSLFRGPKRKNKIEMSYKMKKAKM